MRWGRPSLLVEPCSSTSRRRPRRCGTATEPYAKR
jgi:hypothetical protein